MVVSFSYFAWQGEIYKCEVLHYLQKGEQWFAVVRPASDQTGWLPNEQVDGLTGGVAIPAAVVRRSYDEAKADVIVATLGRIAKGKA